MRCVSDGLRVCPPEHGQACFAGIGLTAEQKRSFEQRFDACDGLTDSEVSMGDHVQDRGGGLRT